MGVFVASMGGTVIGSYLLKRRGGYTSFILGAIGGVCAQFGYGSLTTSPVIDAYLYAFLCCFLRRKYATAHV